MPAHRFAVAILVGALGVGCGGGGDVRGGGMGGGGDGGGANASELSQAEIDGLLFTREEEKLARDVYAALDGYGNPFVNIRGSEQSHMDAVLSFFPEEERVKYSAMTGQSLYYLGETNLRHKILAVV